MPAPRILFCTQTAYRGGGMEAWLDALAAALLRRGWDVHVAAAEGRFHRPAWYRERHPLPNVLELSRTRGLREGRHLRLLETFESVRPDIILPVNLADALVAAVAWKRAANDVRVVTCTHSQDWPFLRDIETFASDIDLATSVSRRVTSLLASIPRLENVRHIPTGIPRPLQQPRVRDSLRNVGYVGRLHAAEKRAGDLIPFVRALEGLDVVVHVAGDGPEFEPIRAALEDSIARGRTVMYGGVPRDMLYGRLYPMLDAVVLFSPAEGGPIAAWEAMAHGVVPVVSDFSGRGEEGILRDEENALVFAIGEPDAAAAQIGRLVDGRLLSRLSAGALAALPPGYFEDAFEDGWDRELRATMRRPMRLGTVPLPNPVSPGSVASLGFGPRLTFAIRRLLGRAFLADDPGSEWPHAYGPDLPLP